MFRLNLITVDGRRRRRGNISSDFIIKLDSITKGTTIANKYYPLYSQFSKENITDDVYLYGKPSLLDFYRNANKYDSLFLALNNSLRAYRYNFTSLSIRKYLKVFKGYIADSDGNILLIVTINKYFDTSYKNDEFNINYDDVLPEYYDRFKVFVSTELINNPIYKNVWKKINMEYISVCYSKNITVEFTTSRAIEKAIFSTDFNVKFSSLTELSNHLKNDVLSIWKGNYDYIPPPKAPDEYTILDGFLIEEAIGLHNELVDESITVTLGDSELSQTDIASIRTGGWSEETTISDSSEFTITQSGDIQYTTIQASNTTFDNVTFEGNVNIEGDGNIIQNSIVRREFGHDYDTETSVLPPVPGRYIVGIDSIEPEVDPFTTNVTPNIDLVDDVSDRDYQEVSANEIEEAVDTVMSGESLFNPDEPITVNFTSELDTNEQEANLANADLDEEEHDALVDHNELEQNYDLIASDLDETEHQIQEELEEELSESDDSNYSVTINAENRTIINDSPPDDVVSDIDHEIEDMEAEARALFGDNYEEEDASDN